MPEFMHAFYVQQLLSLGDYIRPGYFNRVQQKFQNRTVENRTCMKSRYKIASLNLKY